MAIPIIGASSAQHSSAKSIARKPVYKVDPRSAEKWPGDDDMSLTINRALQKSKISDEDKQRAFSVINWYGRVCNPLFGRLLDNTTTFRLGEVTDLFQNVLDELDPKPSFNFSRFGDLNRTICGRDIDSINLAIAEEILLPNNVALLDQCVGLNLDYPEIAISNSGRLVPIYRVEPINPQSSTVTKIFSSGVLEPSGHLDELARWADSFYRDYRRYIGEVSAPPDMFNISKTNDAIFRLVSVLFVKDLTRIGRSIRDEFLSRQRFNSLDVSDVYHLEEVKIGQRHIQYYFANSAGLLLKPSSYLVGLLDKEGKNGQLGNLIIYLRSRLLASEDDKWAGFEFVTVFNHLLGPNSSVLTKDTAIFFAKMFGPYIDSSLKFSETTHTDKIKEAWLTYFRKNLRGKNKLDKEIFIQRFSEAVKIAATKILDEHFYRDLNDVIPGFVDAEVDFREWSDPFKQHKFL